MARDFGLLMVARGLRAFGFGFSTVLIGVHLESRGLDATMVGLAITVSIAGAAAMGVVFGRLARRWGRRRALAASGALMALTGLDLAFAGQPWLLAAAGVTGMLGAASVDVGTFSGLEQAVLTETAASEAWNSTFAHYSVMGSLAAAAGGAVSAAASTPGRAGLFFVLYAGIGLATSVLALRLSPAVEEVAAVGAVGAPPAPGLHADRRLLALYALFAIDSFGGGIASPTVILYWLHVRFGAGSALLGPVFAGTSLISTVSYEASVWLARRVGAVNTMVFPLLGANVLLALIPLAPSVGWAIALLVGRFGIGNMDVPIRGAYLVSIVAPGDRPAAAAAAAGVRGGFNAIGPVISGAAIQAASMAAPFALAGGIKALYCVLLYAGFRGREISPPGPR